MSQAKKQEYGDYVEYPPARFAVPDILKHFTLFIIRATAYAPRHKPRSSTPGAVSTSPIAKNANAWESS
jgi:hypothetical protein